MREGEDHVANNDSDGNSSLEMMDVVAESSVQWAETGKRRQAWFCDAGERIATPLGLEFGYTGNGGACFAGPLAAALWRPSLVPP